MGSVAGALARRGTLASTFPRPAVGISGPGGALRCARSGHPVRARHVLPEPSPGGGAGAIKMNQREGCGCCLSRPRRRIARAGRVCQRHPCDERRRPALEIIGALTSLEHVVSVPYLRPDEAGPPVPGGLTWDGILDHPPVPASGFSCEQVPFGHPLWILFSSGTTGLPKPIMHGHGGILLEQLKLQTFHMDLRAGDRMFFFTTTGWMMWNFLVSSLLLGVCPVLYDGNPAYPGPGALWQLAADTGVCFFGASPSYVDLMTRAGVVPGETHDLSALQTVILAGSPVSAACGAWFYYNVKRDLWLATGSGGTDVCAGFVGGVPTLPVYAGEIQARHLRVAAHAFNERGEQVIDEVGELVITEPMPSMPVGFWGDTDGTRYRESYFAEFPGIWRQGDFFRINARGGCFVLGRSDATLNRHGVRIGTAEIYAALASIDEVADALIVNLDLPGG